MSLPLAEKIERLIEFAHRWDEPPLSDAQLAADLTTRLGRCVIAGDIAGLRDGSMCQIADDMAAALCALGGVTTVAYLLPEGDEDIDIDLRLQLWTLARDRGVQHVAARAMTRDKMREVIADLFALPARTR